MKAIPSHWHTAILVCRKCSRKLDGGFGKSGGKSLAKALRKKTDGRKGRKANFGVVEVDCLKLCPRNGVVVVNAARPMDWLVVQKGAGVEAVLHRLGLAEGAGPPNSN